MILIEPDGERTAVSTNLPGIRAWFVFDPDQGGFYTDGERQKLSTWQPAIPDPEWVPPEEGAS